MRSLSASQRYARADGDIFHYPPHHANVYLIIMSHSLRGNKKYGDIDITKEEQDFIIRKLVEKKVGLGHSISTMKIKLADCVMFHIISF